MSRARDRQERRARISAALDSQLPSSVLILPIVTWYYRRYYASLDVRLTTREFQVSHGVLRIEALLRR